jgi:hypothetical protein
MLTSVGQQFDTPVDSISIFLLWFCIILDLLQ